MKRLNILIIGLFIFSINCFCQIIDIKRDKYWIDGGFGNYYSTGKTDGFTRNLCVNMIIDSTIYKIRLNNYQEFQLWGIDPVEQFNSLGILIGKGYSSKYIQLYFSAGFGIIDGVKRGKLLYTDIGQSWFSFNADHYEKDRFSTLSIPIEVDLLLKPIKYVGVGVSFYCDLNYKRPMYGIIFKFAIGKLR